MKLRNKLITAAVGASAIAASALPVFAQQPTTPNAQGANNGAATDRNLTSPGLGNAYGRGRGQGNGQGQGQGWMAQNGNGQQNGQGMQNGQGAQNGVFGQMQGMMRPDGMKRGPMGSPLENIAQRVQNANFEAAGVTKPSYWDSLVTWLKSDDAKKVTQWLLANPPTPPTDGSRPTPGTHLGAIDWAATGVSKPAFWDSFVSFLGSDDAKKVFEATRMERREENQGERAANFAGELEKVDFQAAGISKPAFWGDLVSWLKGDDAKKLALYMFQQRMQNRPQMPQGTPQGAAQTGQVQGNNGQALGHTQNFGWGNNGRF